MGRASPVSVSCKPPSRAGWSTLHALSSPSLLPVRIRLAAASTSKVHTSLRCATIVCTQCWVLRSHSLRYVSFDTVTSQDAGGAEEEEDACGETGKNARAVIWSRWPRRLGGNEYGRCLAACHAPAYASLAHDVPNDEVRILRTGRETRPARVKCERGDGFLVAVEDV